MMCLLCTHRTSLLLSDVYHVAYTQESVGTLWIFLYSTTRDLVLRLAGSSNPLYLGPELCCYIDYHGQEPVYILWRM